MALPGQVFSWSASFSVPYHYLVSGRVSATGAGVIQHWSMTNSSLPPTLTSTRSVAGKDYIGVAYDRIKQRIYAIELVGKTVEYAAWNGTAALPTTGWTTILNTTQLAELANPDRLSLEIARDDNGATYLRIGQEQQDLLPMMTTPTRHQAIYVDDTLIPVSISRYDPDTWNGLSYSLDYSTLAEGRTSVSVEVASTETATFHLLDLATSQILGSATAPGNSDQLLIPLNTPLTLGAMYQVKKTTEPIEPLLGVECHARYGFPETTANSITIGRIQHAPFAVVGELGFRMYTDVYTENASLADGEGKVTVSGSFALAMRDPVTGVDPVVQVGANYLLQTDLFVLGNGVIGAVPGHGVFMSETVGIPDDPALIGGVFLHQAFVLDQSWYVSDIVGAVIRSYNQPPAAAQSSNTGTPTRRLLEQRFKSNNRTVLSSPLIFIQAAMQRKR